MSRPFPKDQTYVEGSARFTNNEKNVIEILTRKDDDETLISSIFPADPDSPIFQWILNNCEDLDGIHVNTYRWIKEQRLAFEQQVIEIAKREGLIFASGLSDVRSYKSFLETLFEPFDESKESEMNNLFSIKLELFEMPYIRQNTNNDLKKLLRRAETPIEVVKAAIDIQLDNLANGIEIEVEDTSNTTQDSA